MSTSDPGVLSSQTSPDGSVSSITSSSSSSSSNHTSQDFTAEDSTQQSSSTGSSEVSAEAKGSEPSNEELRKAVEEIVRNADLDTTTPNTIVATLSERFGLDLKPRKKVIKQFINDVLNELEQEEESAEEDAEDDDSGAVKKVATKRHMIVMSDKLAEFVGDRTMTRGDVVRYLWTYIRARNLQNPTDRRQIIFDKQLQQLFGTRGASMFQMTKLLNKHIFIAADIYTKTPSVKATVLKVNKKAEKEKAAAEAEAKKKNKQPRAYVSSDKLDVFCSLPLARIVGCKRLTRHRVVKRIWAYIRKHDLQVPEDKRQVRCDDALLQVMGKPVVTIFEIPKFLKDHMFSVTQGANIDYQDFQEFYDPVADAEIGPDGTPIANENSQQDDDEEEQGEDADEDVNP